MSREILLSPKLESARQRLLHKFETEAGVIDPEKGSFDTPWVNQDIDTRLTEDAATLVAQRFKGSRVTRVVGIPTMGIHFAYATAVKLGGINLVPGRKGTDIPPEWRDRIIIPVRVKSLTRTASYRQFAFNAPLTPEDHLLVVDDFCARGGTGLAVVSEFLKMGVAVSYAVYCAKLFQGGFQRIQDLGVQSYYVVGVTKLSENSISFTMPEAFESGFKAIGPYEERHVPQYKIVLPRDGELIALGRISRPLGVNRYFIIGLAHKLGILETRPQDRPIKPYTQAFIARGDLPTLVKFLEENLGIKMSIKFEGKR